MTEYDVTEDGGGHDFQDARASVRAAIENARQARQEAELATERVAWLRRYRAERARTLSRTGYGRAEALAQADVEIEAAVAEQAAAVEAAAEAAAWESSALASFAESVSRPGPAQAAEEMSDDFPVLLGPVRVETRFTDTELLVRVFPDEWAVSAHEERPAESEISAVDRYWVALWQTGGDEITEEAAWRELVSRVGPGRAEWLTGIRQPANPADRPVGVPTGRVVLVIVSEQPLPAQHRQPAVAYWSAIWHARGDATAIRAANKALVTAVGGDQATAIRARRPAGLDYRPPGSGDDVMVAFLVLPPPPGTVAPASWTRAARAHLLPDQFVVYGYADGEQVFAISGEPVPDTLAVSPDPAASDQLRVEADGSLHVPDDLRWMTEFKRAVQVGMGVRIPLDARIREGLDRLLVLGLRLRSSPEQARAELERLITRQFRSPAGFSLLPQGTPTNNTDKAQAGEPKPPPPAGSPAATADDWAGKTDGQWLAELLGIDPAVVSQVPHAAGADQRDARALNTALWPATWGYFLSTMLHPILPADAVADTRAFFIRHVSGRSPLPAVRIGRQPYGILATTAFSRLDWPDSAPRADYRRTLYQVLTKMAGDWERFAKKAAHLGAGGDPHQLLLDILTLHPSSAEFHHRYARSVEDVYNQETFRKTSRRVLPTLSQLEMPQRIRQLLEHLGWPGGQDPDLIRRIYSSTQYQLLGPLVDDRPASETAPIRPCTVDGGNYLDWLAKGASQAFDTVRVESGFTGDKPPKALLYLLLRHAVLLGWEEAARRLAAAAGATVPPPREPLFIHINGRTEISESRYLRLYSPDENVTRDPHRLMVDHIPRVLGTSLTIRDLADQVKALELLREVPTARLERVLTEHLDCCTYRMDAWLLGLVNERLSELRFGDGAMQPRRGVHLGAYGWLEDLKPRWKPAEPVTLPPDLAAIFNPPGSEPLVRDPRSGGRVHAPSPAHATTAAVLRAGYLANAERNHPDTFAVNLTSDRIRVALSFQEGLREGQPLGALLGYRLERGLHDRHDEAEVDKFIAALRLVFPLRALRTPGSEPPAGTEIHHIEQIEARNVVDGLELVRHVTRNNQYVYPFGLADRLPPATPEEAAAIDAEVDRLLDIHDALADLAVAESTHQAMLGNAERASATLDAYAKAGFPPEPAVVETPRSGVTLTHRLGLQFRSGLPPSHGSGLFRGNGPRAKGEPAVNDWLGKVLPKQQDVACVVTWTDPVTGRLKNEVVSQHDLELQPIDLLWAVRPQDQSATTDLDDRIIGHVLGHDRPRADSVLTLRYTERIQGKVSFFELSSLISALRSLLTTSRPLRPSDLIPPAGGDTVDRAMDSAVTLPRTRPAAVRQDLARLRDNLAEYLGDLSVLIEPSVNRAELLKKIDSLLGDFAGLLSRAGGFGMVHSGWAEFATWRRQVYTDVLGAIDVTCGRMDGTLAEADALISGYDRLPPATEAEARFALLQKAERLLTTKPTTPRPSTPQKLRQIVDQRRRDFAGRVDALRRAVKTIRPDLSDLLAEVRGLLPLTDFDPAGLDLTPQEDRVVAFATELLQRARALDGEMKTRLDAADAALADHDQAATGEERVAYARTALKALLGEDVLAVEEFSVPDALAADWRDALDDSEDGTLTSHLERDFPVDDWLHGLARVREKPRLWERALLLGDALRRRGLLGDLLGDDDPELVPIQMPYRPNDRWLGLEFPAGHESHGDRLLYTAHYAKRFQANDEQCGLLLDEWTEVLPADKETTGIAFHFDRPNAESPQALLLVVPPKQTGLWSWDDLVAALHETLELAKSRAVEPEHIDPPAYAAVLPATVTAATRQPVSISTDLARNNLKR